MSTTLDFAAIPPEINSARMYFGAGSSPLLAAASAWNCLAAELRATALSYNSVLSTLTDEQWYGPASVLMAAAATPYVAWMNLTSKQAEQTAEQAEAAAGSYEAAFTATAPPALVATNRSQLAALIATNFLGQNTPAIAANEIQYNEMWCQDAIAMYSYAGSSAAATELSPFLQPQQIATPEALTTQSAAVEQAATTGQQGSLAELISNIPNTLQALASPAAGYSLELSNIPEQLAETSSWLKDFWQEVGPSANIWNTICSSGICAPGTFLDGITLAEKQLTAGALAEVVPTAVGGIPTSAINAIGSSGNSIQASLGGANLVRALSVPPSWTAGAPAHSPLPSGPGGTPMITPSGMPVGMAGLPGVPFGNSTGNSFGRSIPQYGWRPNVVARPPSAG